MKQAEIGGKSFFDRWLEGEGIPVIKDFFVEDIGKVHLEWWERKGGFGCFLNLIGAGDTNNAYICEIPPGKNLTPQRHMYEEMIFVVSGRGATTIWHEGDKKQTFEWQEGSLFSPPLNAWHQHFNGSGDKPARYLAVTSAPMVMNLYHNYDFVFNNPFVFRDRYNSQEDYFSGKGKHYEGKNHNFIGNLWETNFVPDVRGFQLMEYNERGAGSKNIKFELSENTMGAHVSEFPVGSYKKAHRHGPGANVVILRGKGYSLMWPEGLPMKRFDWHEYSMVVPPDMWFHQHFNAGREPARYLALRWGSKKHKMGKAYTGAEDVKKGGNQIEYEDEDPRVREIFEEALAKEGISSRMPKAEINK